MDDNEATACSTAAGIMK